MGEALPPEGRADVVRREQPGQRDDDQVVEEEHPARHEAEWVVERATDERGGAARLRNRSSPLRVREGDEQEERSDEQEDERREPERVQRNDAEGEVERGADLAVGDRGEGRRAEDPLEAELARHQAARLAR